MSEAKVDVYFLSDTTGSMKAYLDAVKNDASTILDRIRATGADVQFGVGNYKDFVGSEYAFSHQQSITTDTELVSSAIKSWSAGGGGANDIPEGQLYALDQLATPGNTIGWRPGSQRILVWFGDAPGHDPICRAISGLPYDITEESVTQKLEAAQIQVVAIGAPDGLNDDPTVTAAGYVSKCGEPGGKPGQAKRITAATGGAEEAGVDADAIVGTIVHQVQTQITTAPLAGPLLSWGYWAEGVLGDGRTANTNVPVHVAGGLTGIRAVAAGWYTSMALLKDGTVQTWGSNDWGERGDGTQNDQTTPIQVRDVTGVRAIAGAYHCLAVRDDDAVWSWGANNYGQLGDGTTYAGAQPTTRRKTMPSPPSLPSRLTKPKAVSVGYHHSLGLDENGTVWAWGINDNGQLGDGTKDNSNIPVQVSGLDEITAIAAGWDFSLALRADGTVWAWGYNAWKQLGNGTDDTASKNTPRKVRNLANNGDLTGVTAIAAGLGHSLAVLEDSTVCVWGSTWEGQGGHGQSGVFYHTPVKVFSDTTKTTELTGVTTVAAGHYHSLALHADGTLSAWGWNVEGQLGDGTTTQRLTPVKVKDPTDPTKTKSLTGVKAIAAGQRHSLACCDHRP